MSDLSPAEKAAVEVIESCPDDLVSDVDLARRVVEAVRPLIAVEVLREAADLARLEADVAEWLLYKFGRMWLSDANKAVDREVPWSEIKKMSRVYARDCMAYMEDLRATYPNGLVREDDDV